MVFPPSMFAIKYIQVVPLAWELGYLPVTPDLTIEGNVRCM